MMMGPKTSNVSIPINNPQLKDVYPGHVGAGEDREHDGGSASAGYWCGVRIVISCCQLALETLDNVDTLETCPT